jgi:bacteriophage exclusion system BrxA-like protein
MHQMDIDMSPKPGETTRWRATGPYLPTLASKTSLLEETRLFLLNYARLHSIDAARQALINGELVQRSRATRVTVLRIVQIRLTRWNPPTWVLDDLVTFAQPGQEAELQAALLLHTARQDILLYDLIQHIVLPHWQDGEPILIRADVQRFLDSAQVNHPEITGWSHATREKLSRNMLTALRDFGLLQGTVSKQIIEPIVPPAVVQHLVRLLQAEGISPEQVAQHADWQLWLWDAARAQKAIDMFNLQERVL